ncbi:serine/threonine protein kinase [Phormidium sp. LEGE 05292]|uniref:protein kinase domain-containing protein n=1 Tax=[Phormidium] sp. LEGE 05292 TaxID=767427 RepID=UPI001882A2B2|nr:serine/threonine protein kinase [Phormidium sp. LEGE 05292]
MSYCLNPNCPNPQNPGTTNFCVTCGAKLLLRERYRAIKPIGQGGFGRTFLAIDEDKPSKPRCVIKQFFPLAQGTNNAQKAAELFNQEAVQLDELGKHPQIPELLAYFTQDNRQYLIQQFIDGQTLSQELAQKGAFNETQTRQLLNDLLPILQFVHSRQVIHRDIKPDNIIKRTSDNKLFLVDFGAAKTTAGTALQQTGTSIGSPEYVAPEQSRGKAVFSSDIYSLGVTCIHLLTKMSPFDLYNLEEDAWIWQQFLQHPVSNALSNILDKMLENAINKRYQSAAEVLKDLNSPTSVTPSQPPVKTPPPTPSANATNKAVKSQVDRELEELRSQFLGTGTSKSQIDIELDEVKSQFDPKAPKNKSNS